MLVSDDFGEPSLPESAVERQIEKSLDDVERTDFRNMSLHPLADFGRRNFGRLAAQTQQRKGDERKITLELPTGFLNLQLFVAARTEQRFDGTADGS